MQTNKDFAKLADAATLNSTTPTTADLWATDASKIYIRRVDGAVPTPTNTRLYRSGVALFAFSTAVNVYVEGIDGEGGNSAATFDYRLTAASALKRVFVAKNCSAKYAGGVVNTASRGFGIESLKGLAYLYGCEGSACATDGINFHDAQANGLQALTVNCSGTDNGRGFSTSNNGHTGHETVVGIDLAGYYPNNRGGSCRWVNSSKVLYTGTYSSDLGDGVGGCVPDRQHGDHVVRPHKAKLRLRQSGVSRLQRLHRNGHSSTHPARESWGAWRGRGGRHILRLHDNPVRPPRVSVTAEHHLQSFAFAQGPAIRETGWAKPSYRRGRDRT